MKEEKTHPIIDKPFEYRIIGFNYQVNLEDHLKSYIDLTLKKGSKIKRLRFYGPQNLKIEEGFPVQTFGMEIIDVRKRQLEDMNLWVTDFEGSPGSITFWAKSVVDLDKEIKY